MPDLPPDVGVLGEQLRELRWVSGLLVAGSLATDDYVAGVSDLDLVALVDGPADPARVQTLAALHRRLDSLAAKGLNLGCAYVTTADLVDRTVRHPTWTHGGPGCGSTRCLPT